MSASLTLVPSHAVWNVSTALNPSPRLFSPGHPDRLADAIAESIVTAAVRQKQDALVGVEIAVHTDCVFVDGRIAAGPQRVDIEKIVRDVYRAAGYSSSQRSAVTRIFSGAGVHEPPLSPEESDIRPFSDDQNIVIGYACGDKRTNYLPDAHWVSCELGRRLFAWLRGALFARARSRILHSRTLSSRSAASFSARICAPNTPR